MDEPSVGELLRRIGSEAKALAKDEIALARAELQENAKRPVIDAAGALLGGVVGLFGLGFLCTTLAVALEPLIAALWLRLLLVSGVYLGTGALIAGYFMKRLRGDIPPKPERAAHHAQHTARDVAEEVKHVGPGTT